MTMTDVWVQQMEQSYDIHKIQGQLTAIVLLLASLVLLQAVRLYREIRK